MFKKVNVFILLIGLAFASACEAKNQTKLEDGVYIHYYSTEDWVKIIFEKGKIYTSLSQNPKEKIPLQIIEHTKKYLLTEAKSKQKNAEGGSKINVQIKIRFEGKRLYVEGISPVEKVWVFSRLEEDNLVLFLPIMRRETHTRIGQSAFYKEAQNIPENFYENLAHVLCHYGVAYQRTNGKVYIAALSYAKEELMWNYTNKAQDAQWLKEHPCE